MTADRVRTLTRLVGQLARRRNAWQVFADFVEVAAISVSNAVDLAQRDAREARYRQVVGRYEPDEVTVFAAMLAEVVLALDARFDDPLGRLFHALELNNKWVGQFFSPFNLCQMLARMTFSDRATLDQQIAARGYLAFHEPACGSGAMAIAAAEVLRDEGFDHQRVLHVTAVDADATCAHMAYVQLSLLHVPAIVVCGDSLTLDERARWYTPAHILGGWSWRTGRSAPARPAPAIAAPGFNAPVATARVTPVPAQLSLFASV